MADAAAAGAGSKLPFARVCGHDERGCHVLQVIMRRRQQAKCTIILPNTENIQRYGSKTKQFRRPLTPLTDASFFFFALCNL
jgi:hypothetical protein